MGKKDIVEMIDQIEIFIENCKYQPLSQTKIVVQKDELLSMIDELKLKLPTEIERCKKIMRNKDAILADARTRSDAIISESVNEANRLVDQHQVTELANIRANEIVELARNEAQQIITEASDQANEIRLGAMYYTRDKLGEMKDIFDRVHEAEVENYKNLIESLENETYVVETNMSEMEANINLLTASSNMQYEDTDDDLDSAFSSNTASQQTPEPAPVDEEDEEEQEWEEDADDEEDDDEFDDFLDE